MNRDMCLVSLGETREILQISVSYWKMTQLRRKHFENVKEAEIQSQTPLREAGPASPGPAEAGGFADLVAGR